MQSEFIVEAETVTKKFSGLVAVDNLSFRVFNGECFRFLGPNGTRKTTTIKMKKRLIK